MNYEFESFKVGFMDTMPFKQSSQPQDSKDSSPNNISNSTNKDSISKHTANNDGTNMQSFSKESQNTINKETSNIDSMSQNTTNKDSINKESINQISKDTSIESIAKDSINTDSNLKSKVKYLICACIIVCVAVVFYFILKDSNFSFEETIKAAWENHVQEWGYLILFLWSILEGEWGLLLAGIASHQGYLNVWLCIFIAGLGGFAGDQIYFYIGRLNKGYVQRKFRSQRRKFALASRLMQKYGWPIIFVQRYMYGLRTIIPISIGLTRYSALKFALINLISAWVWAAITIVPAWYFGAQILEILKTFFAKIKENPLLFAILSVIILCFIVAIFFWRRKMAKSKLKEKNVK